MRSRMPTTVRNARHCALTVDGSWGIAGPAEADELLKSHGMTWRRL